MRLVLWALRGPHIAKPTNRIRAAVSRGPFAQETIISCSLAVRALRPPSWLISFRKAIVLQGHIIPHPGRPVCGQDPRARTSGVCLHNPMHTRHMRRGHSRSTRQSAYAYPNTIRVCIMNNYYSPIQVAGPRMLNDRCLNDSGPSRHSSRRVHQLQESGLQRMPISALPA